MKLKQKILLLALVPLLLSVCIIAFNILQLKSLKSSTETIVQMLVNVEELNSSAKSLSKSLGAYSLNVSASNANDINEDLKKTKTVYNKLDEHITDQEQKEKIQNIDKKYKELASAAVKTVTEENQAEAKRQSFRTKGMVNDVIELKKMINTEYTTMQINLKNQIDWMVTFSITAALILIAGCAAAAFIYAERIVKPIREITKHAEEIAQGNLAVHDMTVRTSDEIFTLNQAFQRMSGNLRELIEQVGNSSSQVAASAEELMASADETMRGTEQITASIQQVSAGAEQQTMKSEESAHAVFETTQEVVKIADNAEAVLHLTASVNENTNLGSHLVKETLNSMNLIHGSVEETDQVLNELNKRSAEIGDILGLITDIADQTNLLALNAAIEAARAGEAGKGFSVVAAEVRKLAEQTRSSVTHISEITSVMQKDTKKSVASILFVKEKVGDGLKVASETQNRFEDILSSVQNVTEQIKEITSASSKISTDVSMVSERVNEMSGVAHSASHHAVEVAAASEEQLASMEEVSAAASSLAHLAEELQSTVSKFRL
ncbi:methyl-accepting chemotaxis protein [Peribacillus deserti]|uniref:Methyl-accepting chemotaxis protein n=1 Tax=Peribacillus deserti TaxID=673318 RepID=A0ABS2QCQ0_9BACI|nr:methyl-accepting chemotaxis protein [Peribacillus deserti]MBM7690933.1 methyl-accepting chemotaxis protein [Peribacillus deserti]